MKKIIIFLALILVIPLVDASIYSLDFNQYTSLNETFKVNFHNDSEIIDPVLNYKKPDDPRWYEKEYNEGFALENFSRQGTYEFFIEYRGTRYPEEGNYFFYINNVFEEYEDKLASFLKNDSNIPSSNDECMGFSPLQGNVSCDEDVYNAMAMEQISSLYEYTKEEGYLDIVNDLYGNWSYSCKDNEGDIICEDNNLGRDRISASFIHGNTVESLWKTYEYTGMEELRELAINYSEGKNTDCNLEDDFLCEPTSNADEMITTKSQDQGYMINAMILAYQKTGEELYKDRAESLIQENLSETHPVYADSLLKASTILEESKGKAKEEFQENLGLCSNEECDNLPEVLPMLFSAIKHSEYLYSDKDIQYLAERDVFDSLKYNNITCDEGFVCSKPFNQLFHSRLAENLAFNIQDKGDGFYGFNYAGNEIGNNVTVDIKFRGEVSEPRIYYKDPILDDDFNYKEIENETFVLEDITNNAGSYLVYFEDETGTRYPDKYFNIPVPIPFIDLEETLEEITLSNPLDYCSPFDGDFSCRYDFKQGDYIKGISTQDRFNTSAEIVGLTNNQIDPVGEYSTCDPYIDDYACTEQPINRRITAPGVERAASLIDGYVEAYRNTNNKSILRDAITLAYEPWEECHPLREDYDCGGSESQAAISKALINLYKETGEPELKSWTENLTKNINKVNSTEALAKLELYSFFPELTNNSIKSFMSDGLNCENDNECSIEELNKENMVAWRAYGLFTENISYFNRANELIGLRPISDQNYCDPNAEESFSERYNCESPSEQGLLINSYYDALNNYVIREPPEVNMTIKGTDEIDLFEETNITCGVENIGNSTLIDENLILSTPHQVISTNKSNESVFESESETSVVVSGLEENQNENITFKINASEGGQTQSACRITTEEQIQQMRVGNIGEALDLTIPRHISESNNHSLNITLQNKYDFVLRNVTLEMNTSKEPINFSENQSINETIKIGDIGSSQNESIDLDYPSNISDWINTNIFASTDFEGFANKTKESKLVENKIDYTSSLPQTRLLEKNNLTFDIFNDKPFNMTNLHLQFDFNGQEIETLNTYKNQTSFNDSFNMSLNESEEFSLEFLTLPGSIGNTTYINYTLVGDPDYNLSGQAYTNPDPSIIDISTNNEEAELFETETNEFSLKNIANRNITNISVDIVKNSTELNLLDGFVEPDIDINNTVPESNFSINNTNKSKIENLVLNHSNNDSLIINSSLINNSDESNLTLNPSFNTSTNFSEEIFVLYNNSKETCESECTLNVTGQNESIKEILPPENSSVKIKNLSIIETNKYITQRGSFENNGFEIYNLKPNEELSSYIDFELNSTQTRVNISANSTEKAVGFNDFVISEFEEEISEETDPGTEGSSATPPPPTQELETITRDIDVFTSPDELNISEELILTKLNFSEDEYVLDEFEKNDCIFAEKNLQELENNKTNASTKLNVGCETKNLTIGFSKNQNFSQLETLEYYSYLNDSEYVLRNEIIDKNITYYNNSINPVVFAFKLSEEEVFLDIPLSFSFLDNLNFQAIYVDIFFLSTFVLVFLSVFTYLAYLLTGVNFFKYLLVIFKKYSYTKEKVSTIQDLFKKKSNVSNEELILYNSFLKSSLLERLIKENKIEDAKQEFNKLLRYWRNNNHILKKSNSDYLKKEAYLLVKKIKQIYSEIKNIDESISTESVEKNMGRLDEKHFETDKNKKTFDAENKNSENEENEEDESEKERKKLHDLYIKIMELDMHIKNKEIEKGFQTVKKIKKSTEKISDEYKSEKEFIESSLKNKEERIKKLAEKSIKYKVKMKLKATENWLYEKFSKQV